jgi:RNA polymerase sigma-70 factor, ECF subfamily
LAPEPLEQVTDESLAHRAQQGDAPAWDALVGRYNGRGIRYIRQQLDDLYLAQDVMQTVWMEIVRSLRQQAPDSFGALFWTILKRRVIDQIRRRTRSQESLELDGTGRDGDDESPRQWASDAPDPAEEAVRLEETSDLYAALERLPDHYAEVLRARALEGRSNRETAMLLVAKGLIQDDGNVEKRVENYWYRGLKELGRQMRLLNERR